MPDVIREAWASVGAVGSMAELHIALDKTMSALKSWSMKLGNVTRELIKSRTQLEELMCMNADRQDIRRVTDKMNELLYQEEMLWLQRSRITWLKVGNRKTKFFQNKAVWRARRNKIFELMDSIGVVHSGLEAMGKVANEYFHNIFAADPSLVASPILDLIEEKVSMQDNMKLCAPFSDKEISEAMFQIGPLKAPGPDGFPACFFQRNWATLKDGVLAAVKEFFRTGFMPEGVNSTSIALIPKISNPFRMSNYRPISLCNVIYKVISKCLVNRLRPLLDRIISPEQSVFIPGRMITDNALVAFECIHYIKKEKDPSNFFVPISWTSQKLMIGWI